MSKPLEIGSGGGGQGGDSDSKTTMNMREDRGEEHTIRSPSPRKITSLFDIDMLGLGLPKSNNSNGNGNGGGAPTSSSSSSTSTKKTTTTTTTTSVLNDYPHLAHYIYSLLSNTSSIISPPRTNNNNQSQHPLSVSSSGESDDDDDDDIDNDPKVPSSQTPIKKRSSETSSTSTSTTSSGTSGVTQADKESLIRKIVTLLDDEQEEEVKEVLKPYLGDLSKDEILMDQVCLDCMHKRKDDVDQVPYAPHLALTPTRARGSPIVTAMPLRPFTPTRMPSFRNVTPIGRPLSPNVTSRPQTPTIAHSSNLATGFGSASIAPAPSSSSGQSSTESPVLSPRMLNAKATTFNPSPRPSPRVTSGSLTAGNTTSFVPSDPWRDVSADPPRSASPFGAIGPATMSRTGSNLAIAAPLFSNQSSPFHSPLGTPNRTPIKMPDVFSSPSPALSVTRASRGIVPDDDDDDEFSPFGKGLPKLHHHEPSLLSTNARPFEPFGGSGFSNQDYFGSSSTDSSFDSPNTNPADFGEDPTEAGAGMTPLDVLCSVFTSVPRSELEDALHRSGYDFEGAMGMLVGQHTYSRSGASTPQRVASPRPMLGVGGRGAIPVNHHAPRDGYFQQGGRSFRGDISPGFSGTRSPGGNGGKMCRYFLAGECRRSDCRFSHDIDRALCRFWLRGHCAKGPNCEFLHQLPNNLDTNALANAMSNVEISSDGYARPTTPTAYTPQEEFPDLLAVRGSRPGARFDPSRNRFANAVKRVTPVPMPTLQVTGARLGAAAAAFSPSMEGRTVAPIPAVPRPSQRIKLRPATLLPTLKTGTAANEQYMTNRANAIRLGHARNACLARAADAFRRGDGAAAKRFSREGKALNQRMINEASEVAQVLVRERKEEATKAIRERDPSWSDDPFDRSQRGKECAAGLGVIMGVASKNKIANGAGDRLSSDERTEALLDLHTLHGTEGAEIAGQFLVELERERFRGLAYIVVGEEKHVGSQDPLRGASKVRLGTSVKQSLAEWGYAWNENGGVICVDPCRV